MYQLGQLEKPCMHLKAVVSAHANRTNLGPIITFSVKVTRFDRDYFDGWADAHADSQADSAVNSALSRHAKPVFSKDSTPKLTRGPGCLLSSTAEYGYVTLSLQ